MIRSRLLAGSSFLAMSLAVPAAAQSVPEAAQAGREQSGDAQSGTTPSTTTREATGTGDIVVTAQRRAESLQSVPISVSAFSGEALERQQIQNSSDLQLSLPNVTFTKTNFTSSSFTIRGIGDLCVGFSCDRATGIHLNDMPLVENRLFETEYFDLERIEVLRGPQGTLYGRNATSGVVNMITARPQLGTFAASATAEIGNHDSRRLTGMLNVPIADWAGLRVAGTYLKRGGFTRNLFDNSRIDGRDLYALRGTLRIRPTSSTTLDLIAYTFSEDDDRSRIQKQLCARDNTGILGCRPDRLGFDTVNGNSTLAGIVSSAQVLGSVSASLVPFALTNLYGADPFFGQASNPADLRTVRTDFNPTYKASENIFMARLEQGLGEQFSLTVTGGLSRSKIDSRTDYTLTAGAPLAGNPGLLALAFAASQPGGAANPFTVAAQRLIPNGPLGPVCTSETNLSYSGLFGGFTNRCTAAGTEYDRSQSDYRQTSIEAHLDSDLEGPFNFILGGIYTDGRFRNSNYYVASFGLDYGAALIGIAQTLGARAVVPGYPQVYRAPPFFNSEVQDFRLKSTGLFGDATYDLSDRLKLTAGLRWSQDRKSQVARAPLLEFFAPVGVADAFSSPFVSSYDADPRAAGNQLYARDSVKFSRLTGRLVVDYELSRNNLVYASYSRGYKAGGINPPISPIFAISPTFAPETINAFEIGSKNSFLGGLARLNLSAFYYDYKALQLSRIVGRTSVNDNTDAGIWGLEAEGVVRPIADLLLNFSGSYLKSKIKGLSLVDPRDPSGGRSDVVIIKDLENASNCVVAPLVTLPPGSAAGFVGAVNGSVGLQPPVAVPGTRATGAFGSCAALAATVASPPAALRAALGVPAGALPFGVTTGIEQSLNGNQLPQSPNWKFASGAQYTFRFGNGFTLVPRADVAYTGRYYARSFNTAVDRIDAFTVVNAQLQLTAPDDRWNLRAFVQNLTDNDAITGLYVGDQSSGLYTNAFTLEPRRYGVSVGFSF
jgi:outer membrane receptor protein involved in Fe transport